MQHHSHTHNFTVINLVSEYAISPLSWLLRFLLAARTGHTSLLILLHVVEREPLSVLLHQWTVELLTQQQLEVAVGAFGVLYTLRARRGRGRREREAERRGGRDQACQLKPTHTQPLTIDKAASPKSLSPFLIDTAAAVFRFDSLRARRRGGEVMVGERRGHSSHL